MIEIICGTDRSNSNSLQVARLVGRLFEAQGVPAQILNIQELNLADVSGGHYKGAVGTFKTGVQRVNSADGLFMIIPEYNGSYPGILKLFIDYWTYPETFEARPVAFVGLGGRWGGLRAVEHLQQVFGYRNAYIFPNRVFLNQIETILKDGEITDPAFVDLLKNQTRDFVKYMAGLKSQGLDANSKAIK